MAPAHPCHAVPSASLPKGEPRLSEANRGVGTTGTGSSTAGATPRHRWGAGRQTGGGHGSGIGSASIHTRGQCLGRREQLYSPTPATGGAASRMVRVNTTY